MGGGAQLQLDSTQSTGAPDPATDAAAQRHRSLEHDAQNGLAALFTSRSLMASENRSPPRDRHDAITQKLGLVLALSVGLLSYGLGVRGNHERHGALAKGRSGVEKEESINLHPSRRRDRDRHHRYRLVCPLGTTAASGSFDQELTTHR